MMGRCQVRVAPEVGDATLGGWVGSMTKDSGLPVDHTTGTFYKVNGFQNLTRKAIPPACTNRWPCC